jgi:hypothetical protein
VVGAVDVDVLATISQVADGVYAASVVELVLASLSSLLLDTDTDTGRAVEDPE